MIATPTYQIRADFDADTIVVYQAFNDAIADAALAAGRFVQPFSVGRMTWIKPSFAWLMERSGWATKPDQERILAIRITETSPVRVQWDPERTLAGGKLPHRSIQVGLGRAIVQRYVDEWTREIRDLTPLVRRMRAMSIEGRRAIAPPERPYVPSPDTARRLGMGDSS